MRHGEPDERDRPDGGDAAAAHRTVAPAAPSSRVRPARSPRDVAGLVAERERVERTGEQQAQDEPADDERQHGADRATAGRPAREPTTQNRYVSNTSGLASVIPSTSATSTADTAAPASTSRTGVARRPPVPIR